MPLRYLGWISYILYLSHDFVLFVFAKRFPNRLWLSAPLAFVISIAFATLMRYILELPLQELRARFRRVAPVYPPVPANQVLLSDTTNVG